MEWRSEVDAVFCSNTLWEIGGKGKKRHTTDFIALKDL